MALVPVVVEPRLEANVLGIFTRDYLKIELLCWALLRRMT